MLAKKKIVVANWKLNPHTSKEARRIFNGFKKGASGLKSVQTVVCPPFLFLELLVKLYKGHRIAFGAQDIFWEEKGGFTGEIAPSMVKKSGALYTIVGHSERRKLGETDEAVNNKVRAALKAGLTPILCIGEHERDHLDGEYLAFLKGQLAGGLSGVTKKQLSKLVIAYEPVWAIGKTADHAMQARDVHETSLFIRKVLRELYKTDAALRVPILYGGSVEPENAAELITGGHVEGFLVGHKSLEPKGFSEILKIVERA